jgi:hypothetical protein
MAVMVQNWETEIGKIRIQSEPRQKFAKPNLNHFSHGGKHKIRLRHRQGALDPWYVTENSI